MNSTRNIQLVIFDMDGVLFEGSNFWLELHARYGTEREGVELARQYLASDYNALAEQVVGVLWKGRPASVYMDMVTQRAYQPGVDELFRRLRQHAVRSAIISSGSYDLAARAQRDLGIHEVRANRLRVQNGALSGEIDIMVPDAEKEAVGLNLMSEMRLPPEHTAFVGDSDSDIALAKRVELAVAYNSDSEKLKAVCAHVLRHGQLINLAEILGLTAGGGEPAHVSNRPTKDRS